MCEKKHMYSFFDYLIWEARILPRKHENLKFDYNFLGLGNNGSKLNMWKGLIWQVEGGSNYCGRGSYDCGSGS